MVGEVLGNYRVISELTSGGMGTLYRARHELLGRSAAVKLLRPELTANDELLQRFYNEARAATTIRHPGIVEVYDFGYTGDGRAYIVMELLDGEPLGERLRRRGRLTEVETENFGRQIAGALRAAHASGIVHRDLKPDNVFLVPDPDGRSERVKVLDFGVAKLTGGSRHTQTGALMGTPLYMAPEQARAAGAIDHRADLYSLGCMLYEMLVGRPPFVAEGAGEIIALQMFAPPEPPRNLLTALTPELDAIVLRLLEKEPHDRYQDAFEVQTALEAIRGTLSSARADEIVRESKRFTLSMSPGPTQQRTVPIAAPPPALVPPPVKTSAMPVIAGIVTLAIAAAVAVFVITRPGAAPATPAPIAAPTPPAPPPIVKAAVEPPALAPPGKDAVEPAPLAMPVVTAPVPVNAKRVAPRTAKPRAAKPTTSTPCVTPNGSPCEETL